MICAVIKGPTISLAYQQIKSVMQEVQLIELRLDLFENYAYADLIRLSKEFKIPMIFTLRSLQQGGHYKKEETIRMNELRQLAALLPEFLDLESHLPEHFIKKISQEFPRLKIILSHHDFQSTPEDLDGLFIELKKKPAHFYKIALKANQTRDCLRLLIWQKRQSLPLIVISMGECGQMSRILSPIFTSLFTYACLEKADAVMGQLSVKELKETYHHSLLNPQTTIYGLIGDPVTQSIGSLFHNKLIRQKQWNSIYVKMVITLPELKDFFYLIRQLPFKGLSVTMPLKENVHPFVDFIEEDSKPIQALNTLIIEGDLIKGMNTDGKGALDALEMLIPVSRKKVIILGAGGAAKAIAYEAIKRGAFIKIINRDRKKAIQLAANLGCAEGNLNDLKDPYDVLINCTPLSMPIEESLILSSAVIMDISTKKEVELLQKAQSKGCRVINGYQMWIEQAAGQWQFWSKKGIDILNIRELLSKDIFEK